MTDRPAAGPGRVWVMVFFLLILAACGETALLSAPRTWGSDFTDRSPATASCPGGTLSQLRRRMAIWQPEAPLEIQRSLPEPVRVRLSDEDSIHEFQFSETPASGPAWGFGGYLVTRKGCIVHAEIRYFDN